MEHIGIDLGSRDSQVCVRDGAGAILEEARRTTTGLGRWLADRPPARVVIETCTECFRVRLAPMAAEPSAYHAYTRAVRQFDTWCGAAPATAALVVAAVTFRATLAGTANRATSPPAAARSTRRWLPCSSGGLRRSEAAALEWRNVSPAARAAGVPRRDAHHA